MDQQTIDAYDAARDLSSKPFRAACYAPFTSVYFKTNGDVIACCKNHGYVLGNVADERLEDIWRGKRASAMRKAMQKYQLGVGCDFCEWQIEGGEYAQVYARLFDSLPFNEQEGVHWPTQMEFTVSNTCNLGCIMCYGTLSSTIRAHRDKLPPLPKVYDDRFFDDLRKFLPHLRRAKFFGGEPFLAQENYRIWDMMIEDGIEIPIHVTTNGTQYNSKVERILEAFPVSLSISLDGATKETMERIRVNANFEVVRANIEKFLAYTKRRGTTLGLPFCLMQQNWHEFGEYLRYADSLGVRVFINTVIDPPECSLYTLSPDELRVIAEKLDAMGESKGYARLELNGETYRSAVRALFKNASERQREGVSGIKQSYRKHNHIPRGWELVRMGKFDEALAEAEQVRETDPAFYQSLPLRAHALRMSGRLDDAEAVLEQAIASYRKGPHAHLELAWLRLQQKQPEAALTSALEAKRLCAGAKTADLMPHVLNAVSAASLQSGRAEDGLQAADEGIGLAPGFGWLRVNRAWCLFALGRHAEARACADDALEIMPDNAEAKRVREMSEEKLAASR